MLPSEFKIEDHFVSAAGRLDRAAAYRHRPNNVVVIAPHPDDDVIGAGGTMALMSRRHLNVFSVFVTDGFSPIFKSEDTGRIRRQEALDALRAVGAKGGVFLEYKSSRIKKQAAPEALKDLRSVLAFLNPGEVYVPSPLERHITHRQVTGMTLKAIRNLRGFHAGLWGYHVWGAVPGVPGSKRVDISSVIGLKTKAVRCHKSQVRFKELDRGITGLNRFEAVFHDAGRPDASQYIESFLDMRPLVSNRRLTLRAFSKKVLEGLLPDSD